ncbi:MAG TPA: hypothetical protein VD788_00825, partial [Candidatus Polarisedimenticolaceae bacterium]|nr:hypothetical protein [Candidatus Polarisedimenticolaceae bacterium]
FDGTTTPQSITLDLDLDASGGVCNTPPCMFEEGWENLPNDNCADDGGTACRGFQAINKDFDLQDLVSADGYRCQYHDPDWPNSLAYQGGVTDCFLGEGSAHAARFWWQINTPADPNGGKRYSGQNSLYMGDFGTGPDTQTTPISVLEFLQMIDPIPLGLAGDPPELSFVHQVDFMDDRNVNVLPGQSPARGIVSLQLADTDGDPVGNWIKLQPYLNIYDTQAQDQYFNCSFDPIDDGNDEDSFFDPTDPDRRLGPSTSCSPEMAFVYMGETFSTFSEGNLAKAEGPGLAGADLKGTWVESKFNLERFRGRSVRLRFMYTDLKTSAGTTWESLFALNPGPGDDGWWIDDLRVTNTLDTPADILNDDKDNSGLPASCGTNCTTITMAVTRDPVSTLTAPGQVVEFDATNTSANRCLDGTLQYQFWRDGNANNMGGDPLDTLLRGWTDNPVLIDAPTSTTNYVVEARCSTATTCVNRSAINVAVNCPASGALVFPTITSLDGDSLMWTGSETYNWARGNLITLDGSYTPTGSAIGVGPGTSFSISGDVVAPGAGNWYLFRRPGALGGGGGFCNDLGVSWGTLLRDANLP